MTGWVSMGGCLRGGSVEVRRVAQVVVVVGQGGFGRLVQGRLIEAVFEDGLDRAHRVRPHGEGTLGGGLESGVGVGLGQAQDTEAGAGRFARGGAGRGAPG